MSAAAAVLTHCAAPAAGCCCCWGVAPALHAAAALTGDLAAVSVAPLLHCHCVLHGQVAPAWHGACVEKRAWLTALLMAYRDEAEQMEIANAIQCVLLIAPTSHSNVVPTHAVAQVR